MHYPNSRWRPRCQGKSRDDVSGRILLSTQDTCEPSALILADTLKIELILQHIPKYSILFANKRAIIIQLDILWHYNILDILSHLC